MLLKVQQPLTGHEIALSPGLTIGREGCEIILPDPEVSRRHAIVRRLDSGLALEDLGSLNGTWINDRRIDAVTELRPGDVVRFGNTVCSVQASGPHTVVSARPPLP